MEAFEGEGSDGLSERHVVPPSGGIFTSSIPGFRLKAVRHAGEEPFVIATVVAYKSPQSAKPGSKAIIKADGSMSGWIGGGCVQPIVIREAKKALATGKPKLICISPESSHGDWKGVEVYQMTCQGGGSLEIYLEPVLPKTRPSHRRQFPVAQILTGLGKLLEFNVCIADPEATQAVSRKPTSY